MKTIYTKIYLGIIASIAILHGGYAHAMRCGTELVEINEPIFLVKRDCGIPLEERVVNNSNSGSRGDEVYLYYRTGSKMIQELYFIDGHLNSINEIWG
jgi:hypothetical protein